MSKKTYRALISGLSGALLMCVLLAADLVTKAWAAAVNIQQSDYFLGIVRLSYATNPGIAFGIASDNPVAMGVITGVVIVLVVALAVAYFTLFRHNPGVRVCLAVVEAGAVGNLIDRLSLGWVRDFIDVRPLHFGICNLADFFITFGIVVLVFMIMFIGKNAVFPLTKKWREEAKAEEARALRAEEGAEGPARHE